MNKCNETSEFLIAKIELSTKLQYLSAIAQSIRQTVKVPRDNALGPKLAKLRVAIETANCLTKYLRDIISEDKIEVNTKIVKENDEKIKSKFTYDVSSKRSPGSSNVGRQNTGQINLNEKDSSNRDICNDCGGIFAKKDSVKDLGNGEVKEQTETKNQFTCDVCRKTFSGTFNPGHHNSKQIHSNEKDSLSREKLVCDVCFLVSAERDCIKDMANEENGQCDDIMETNYITAKNNELQLGTEGSDEDEGSVFNIYMDRHNFLPPSDSEKSEPPEEDEGPVDEIVKKCRKRFGKDLREEWCYSCKMRKKCSRVDSTEEICPVCGFVGKDYKEFVLHRGSCSSCPNDNCSYQNNKLGRLMNHIKSCKGDRVPKIKMDVQTCPICGFIEKDYHQFKEHRASCQSCPHPNCTYANVRLGRLQNHIKSCQKRSEGSEGEEDTKREEKKAKARDYYYANREERKAKARDYYYANREERKAKARDYYYANREEKKVDGNT